MARVAASPDRPRRSTGIDWSWKHYQAASARPLAALAIIAPLLLAHEIGIRILASGIGHRTTASLLIQQFFDLMGPTMSWLPAAVVTILLLCVHIARHDPWVVELPVVVGMLAEGIMWGMCLVLVQWPILWQTRAFGQTVNPGYLACLLAGAGVYEETLFRLIGFWFFAIILSHICGLGQSKMRVVTIVATAAGFAAIHALGTQVVSPMGLTMIFVRGLFYGVLFVGRGFGVTVVAHTAYDLGILLCDMLKAV